MAAVAESSLKDGMDEIVGGIRGMIAESKAGAAVTDALTPAELMDRCVLLPLC